MQAVTVADIDIGVDVQTHELVQGVLFAADQGLASDEIIGLGLQGHGEADARFERVGLVGEIIARKDQPGLDAHHIKGGKAHGLQPQIAAIGPDGIIDRVAILGVAEDFKAQLTGIAGA